MSSTACIHCYFPYAAFLFYLNLYFNRNFELRTCVDSRNPMPSRFLFNSRHFILMALVGEASQSRHQAEN
jgi:hypothetical protein